MMDVKTAAISLCTLRTLGWLTLSCCDDDIALVPMHKHDLRALNVIINSFDETPNDRISSSIETMDPGDMD